MLLTLCISQLYGNKTQFKLQFNVWQVFVQFHNCTVTKLNLNYKLMFGGREKDNKGYSNLLIYIKELSYVSNLHRV